MDPAIFFIVVMLVVIFGVQMVHRWWLGNEWKRQWRRASAAE
jgi:hypothetical protein